MKKITALCIAFVLLASLAACGRPSASSASSGSAFISSSASSASAEPDAPKPGISSSSVSDSVDADASDTGTALPALEDPAIHFITLPCVQEDGSEIEKGLLVTKTPQDWDYDSYTTFFKNEKKIAEVLNLWPAAEGTSPFADFMLAPYIDNGMFPEGFGLVSSEERTINENPVRILHMKTWSDDADAPSYPLFVFYQIEGYVIEVHFYSDIENDPAQTELFLSVLSTFDLHFSRDNVTESDASESAPASSQDNA